jgi:hypothetical protein
MQKREVTTNANQLRLVGSEVDPAVARGNAIREGAVRSAS